MIWFATWLVSTGLLFPAFGLQSDRLITALLVWLVLGLASLFLGPWLLVIGLIASGLLFWQSRHPDIQKQRYLAQKAAAAESNERVSQDLYDQAVADLERDYEAGLINDDDFEAALQNEADWLHEHRKP